jgi:hypothetical protein
MALLNDTGLASSFFSEVFYVCSFQLSAGAVWYFAAQSAWQNGSKVRVEVAIVDDIDSVMDRLGIPMELRSCHVSIVEGYVVVGHVPAEAIKKLLSERPNIKGISLPGMPPGSPGMPGTKEKPFTIYSIEDRINIYMVI